MIEQYVPIEIFNAIKNSKIWDISTSQHLSRKICAIETTLFDIHKFNELNIVQNVKIRDSSHVTVNIHLITIIRHFLFIDCKVAMYLKDTFLSLQELIKDKNIVSSNLIITDYDTIIDKHRHGSNIANIFTIAIPVENDNIDIHLITDTQSKYIKEFEILHIKNDEYHEVISKTPCFFWVFNIE